MNYIYIDGKMATYGTSPKAISGLEQDTEYSVHVQNVYSEDGQEGEDVVLKSEPIMVKTSKYVKATDFGFMNIAINVTPKKATRLATYVLPEDATNKEIHFSTDVGNITDGYITLDNVGDVAYVDAQHDDIEGTRTLQVECVEKEIPLKEIEIASISSDSVTVGNSQSISIVYNPMETTQRAVEIISSDEGVATISFDNGTWKVNGISEGTSKLAVKSLYDESITYTFDVKVIKEVVEE